VLLISFTVGRNGLRERWGERKRGYRATPKIARWVTAIIGSWLLMRGLITLLT
jgi:hypothetical protein